MWDVSSKEAVHDRAPPPLLLRRGIGVRRDGTGLRKHAPRPKHWLPPSPPVDPRFQLRALRLSALDPILDVATLKPAFRRPSRPRRRQLRKVRRALALR